jgi:endoglucanase
MRLIQALPILGLLAGFNAVAAENPVRLNSVGFLPQQIKQASIGTAGTNFSVIRLNDARVIYSGALTGPRTNADTGEALFSADFTALTNTGTFQVTIPGVGESPAFRIGPDIYRDPYVLAMRAFYLWRCGTPVSLTIDGKTSGHAACHTNDAWLDFVTGTNEHRASVGGWHDAGDYNKYVVNAGVAVGVLLRAWEDFNARLAGIPLRLPEASGRLPEFLAEVKWELDWLLTMQDAAGSVFHKVSTRAFGGFIKPEQETEPRYFASWSTEATANFVGMMAAAARAFQPYDKAYADRFLRAAEKSYAFLVAHPTRKKTDQSKFKTGTYEVGDEGARLWAAAEMWETTGREDCLRDFEQRLKTAKVVVPVTWDYYNPGPLGCVSYLFSKRAGRDAELVSTLKTNLLATADRMVAAAKTHGYAWVTAGVSMARWPGRRFCCTPRTGFHRSRTIFRPLRMPSATCSGGMFTDVLTSRVWAGSRRKIPMTVPPGPMIWPVPGRGFSWAGRTRSRAIGLINWRIIAPTKSPSTGTPRSSMRSRGSPLATRNPLIKV